MSKQANKTVIGIFVVVRHRPGGCSRSDSGLREIFQTDSESGLLFRGIRRGAEYRRSCGVQGCKNRFGNECSLKVGDE